MYGQVTTWFMTPEQLAEYVKKNPIKPTKKPKEAKFSTDTIDYKVTTQRKKDAMKGNRVIDKIDKDKANKLFVEGVPLEDIAKACGLSRANLNNFIKEQRKLEPEKWPSRVNRKG